jgi:hypothetical protein
MKTSKKYKAIVKIKNNPDGTAFCVKYRFDDLLKFTNFLDSKWQDWKWYNVFSNKKQDKGQQIGSFTKHNKPNSRFI